MIPGISLVEEHRGEDNRRFVVGLPDGGRVEAVLYRGDSLCVSAQVGCAVGCPFCASGARGLDRPLSFEELVAQVQLVQEVMGTQKHELRRVTVSGVGEPLHNHRAVCELVSWCREQDFGLSITTSGGPLRHLQQWLCEVPHRGLTVSVHAGTEGVRQRMVPRAPSLQDLFEVIDRATSSMSRARQKKIALAYLLIRGINDSDEEIDAFAQRAAQLPFKLHLYRYNPVPTSALEGVDMPRYHEIAERLQAQGLQVRRSAMSRTRKNGGCGTLVAKLRPQRGRLPVIAPGG